MTSRVEDGGGNNNTFQSRKLSSTGSSPGEWFRPDASFLAGFGCDSGRPMAEQETPGGPNDMNRRCVCVYVRVCVDYLGTLCSAEPPRRKSEAEPGWGNAEDTGYTPRARWSLQWRRTEESRSENTFGRLQQFHRWFMSELTYLSAATVPSTSVIIQLKEIIWEPGKFHL